MIGEPLPERPVSPRRGPFRERPADPCRERSQAAAEASRARWAWGGPKSCASAAARLKWRWAECSQVMPVPPWIWMFSPATERYASVQ
nr:hypothetical protein GCM10020093_103370 [Planobispora longispora]